MNWPGNHSAQNSQSQPFSQSPLPYRLPSNDIVAWVWQSLLCWPLQDHSVCVTLARLGHSQRQKSLGGDMSQKYSFFCFTNFKILGSLYIILVYVPSLAQKSCDSWYVHAVLKHRTEAFNLICCSGDWKTASYKIAYSGTNYVCITALCRSFIIHFFKNWLWVFF